MSDIKDFCHLHVHSMYSILDGENRIEALVEQANLYGMKHVALTDHGTMMGSLKFYKECKEKDIKPVIGVEAYITGDPDGLDKPDMTKDNHHLVMVAQNDTGLKNLMDLVSRAQLHNFYYKPRISKHNLTPELTEGIIATSACLGNEINRVGEWNPETGSYDNLDAMREAAAWYAKTFPNRYYLEIQDNDDEAGQQAAYNAIVIRLAKELGLKNVITSDAHYTTLEAANTHTMLMAMQFKKTLADYVAGGEMKYGPWFYLRSPEEMLEAARKYDCEEAFWNTVEIGNQCNVNIELGVYQTPEFNIQNEPDYADFLASEENNGN
jgi:DNA polymerase III subunit alpha